ncbi:MAG: class I SAM-dependent RNA methyltransferase [Verrucomicrobia bacterium]|nr:class I SAM-dependent RNA methyltransferase [Verrucomicrobiota bacterium]
MTNQVGRLAFSEQSFRMPHHVDPRKNRRLIRSLSIEEIAFGGSGVGRSDGKVVFVPFTIDREIVDVELTAIRRSYSLGKLEAIRQASPERVNPPCPFFESCGGCDYQHIAYSHQLIIKQNQVEQALRRIAKLPNPSVRPIQPSPKPFGYRNRIAVHADGEKVGFFKKGTRTVVDITKCLLASDTVDDKLREFRATRPAASAHVTLRENSQITTFSQTNDSVAQLLLEFVRRRIHGSTLIDGYCGSGFFGHNLAEAFKNVIGIDWNQSAIHQAQRTAGPNETYLCGDLGELLDQLLATESPDTVIVDPSATGISQEVAAALARRPPSILVYVSCDPATFARDTGRLSHRFQLLEVQPFDMFPQTAEIEVVGILKAEFLHESSRGIDITAAISG